MKKLSLAVMTLLCLPTAHTFAATLAGSCNPVAVTTCALPFPSDLFMDQETHQLSFDDAIIDRNTSGPIRTSKTLLSQMDPSFSPSTIFNGSTGYSAAGPVLFELPAEPASTLAKDGGDMVVVYDLDSGKKIDMVTNMSMAAHSPRDKKKASNVIELWPRSRFEFGHRYVAALTMQLKAKSGSTSVNYVRSPGMDVALGIVDAQTDAEKKLFAAYAPALDVLSIAGIEPEQIFAATFFTVRTEAEVTGPLFKMAQYITAQPLKFSGLAPGEPLDTGEYALGTLYGRVDLVNFRDSSGAVLPPYEPIASSTQDNVEVLFTIPRVDAGMSTPIASWAHGVGNEKENTKTGFQRNDAAGIVSVAIDHPNHGSRIVNSISKKNLKDFASLTANPKQMMAALGVYVQASLDQVALMTAVRNNVNDAFDTVRPQMPDLAPIDINRKVYHSLSFGSMVGVAATAVSNDYLGAFFLSGCGGLMHILSSSLFWDVTNKNAFPKDATGAEVMFQVAMMQQYVDIADGLNFAQYYRNPPPGYTQKRVVMQYAIDDGNVINEISEAQAIVMDLPLLKNVYRATPWLRAGSEGIDDYEDGYGIYQLPYIVPDAEEVLANAASTQQELEALAAQNGKTLSFSLVDFLSTLIYSDYNRFLVHLTTAIPESTLKNRAWNCQILSMPENLCTRGIDTAAVTP